MKQRNRNNRGGNRNRGNRRQRLRRQVRRERRQTRGAENFRKPLTGKRARKVAKAQAGREFNPVIRQIKGEREGSRKRQKQLGDWFTGLENQTADNYARSQVTGARVQMATDAQLKEAAKSNEEMLEGLAKEEAERAEKLGGTANTGMLAGIAAGNTATQQQAVSLAAPLQATELAHQRELLARRGAHRLAGVEARRDEMDRRDKIVSDLRAARRERGAATADRLQALRAEERDYDIQQRAFTDEKPYEEAIREQAQLGLAGKRASARAQVKAAGRYGRARERSASATERAAKDNRRGKNRSARAQENAAKAHSRGGGGGYNVREAKSLLRSSGQDFKGKGQAIDYLVNRGVKRSVAKRAVGQLLSGGGGGKRKVRPKGRRRTR